MMPPMGMGFLSEKIPWDRWPFRNSGGALALPSFVASPRSMRRVPFYEAFGNDVGVPQGRDILKETERKVSSLTSIHSEFRER